MKKILIISLSIQIIIISLWFIYLHIKNENSIYFNTIKIIKESEIVKNSENPKWVFNNQTNINKNILSWVFINENTLITASHWVDNINSKYKMIDNNWFEYHWKLIFKDSENDFAKIKIENNFNNFKNIKIWEIIKIWEEIWSIWFDEKNNFSTTMTWKILDINWNKIKTDIVFVEWNSGWAIYNKNNELIWIALEVDTKNNVSYFLKISDFLK